MRYTLNLHGLIDEGHAEALAQLREQQTRLAALALAGDAGAFTALRHNRREVAHVRLAAAALHPETERAA